MSGETVRLYSDGLLSKWGFSDGDQLDELIWDRCEAEGIRDGGSTHPVLIRAVREYLLPAIEQTLDVYEISTIHNPIRTDSVDGVEIDGGAYQPTEIELTPEYVDVPFDVIWQWYLEGLEANR